MDQSRAPIPQGPALSRILEEAGEIARATGSVPNSAHLLLALFTSRNRAERLLRDRGIDEDRILEGVDPRRKEPAGSVGDIMDRAEQVAAGCGARQVDALHVLVAMTRIRRSLAHALLEQTGEKLGPLRTRALTILTGAVPRWLEARTERPRGRSRSEDPRPSPRRTAARGRPRTPTRPASFPWTPPLVTPSGPVSPPARRPRAAAARPSPAPSRPPLSEAPRSATSEKPGRPLARAITESPRKEQETPRPAGPDDPTAAAPPPPPRHGSRPRPPAGPVAKYALTIGRYPWLSRLGRNLTQEAAEGRLDRLVGRAREVETLIDVLGKRRANNPCLVGEPGVGKTAVVEGLAHTIVHAPAGHRLADKILVGLDVGALLVGTHLRGSFSEKLQGIREEVRRSDGRILIFFDELHTLVGAGGTGEGPHDAAQELKSALARGDFPCIGATTYAEYAQHIEKDPALSRRFVPVRVEEPTPDAAVHMLRQMVVPYADHHDVGFRDEAIVASVRLSTRHLSEGHLPDKALALLDLAGSRAARQGDEEVTAHDVARIVAERTGIPVERLTATDRERLLTLERQLMQQVVGHEEPLRRIAEVIRRGAAGFRSQRPLGAFLFLGPTGVGKTETAKAIARALHGEEQSMVRLDLSEFAEAHTVARLVGAPPGYVGHDAGGELTEAVRRKPGRVVLFDEIEKAHRDVLQLLLQILDEGRLTDAKGRVATFSESIVVLTSNLGAEVGPGSAPIGFGRRIADDPAAYATRVLKSAQRALAPELWGRIEERLVFVPLTRDDARAVCDLMATDSSRRLERERGITFALDEPATEFVLEEGGFDPELGARPMRQVLSRIVEGPIAGRILEGRIHAGEHVQVTTREDGSLLFKVEGASLSQRPRR